VAVVGSSGIVGNHDTSLVAGPVVVIGRKGTAGSVIWVGRDAWPIDTTFIAEPRDGVSPVFLYFWLRGANFPHLVADSAVPGLNRAVAEDRRLVIPPDNEIERFTAFATPLFESKERLVNESATLTSVRDALLPKLISGEIRVPDTADPEEVIGPAGEDAAAAV